LLCLTSCSRSLLFDSLKNIPDQVGHGGGIANPQAFDTMNAELRVNGRHRIGSHFARADGTACGAAMLAPVIGAILIRLQIPCPENVRG
jgi:hypothetical protein